LFLFFLDELGLEVIAVLNFTLQEWCELRTAMVCTPLETRPCINTDWVRGLLALRDWQLKCPQFAVRKSKIKESGREY
jgi:hypothetical protein